MGFFSWGLKNEFETAMVNEPSVFESLMFYCSFFKQQGPKFSQLTIILKYNLITFDKSNMKCTKNFLKKVKDPLLCKSYLHLFFMLQVSLKK